MRCSERLCSISWLVLSVSSHVMFVRAVHAKQHGDLLLWMQVVPSMPHPSSAGSPPRQSGTFYRNPFGIESPFKELHLHPLSGRGASSRARDARMQMQVQI